VLAKNERRRQKGLCKKFIPANDYGDYLDFVHFEGVENINKDDETGPGITSTKMKFATFYVLQNSFWTV
jgi:hypothetical protein